MRVRLSILPSACYRLLALALIAVLSAACSVTKHVPEGRYLLDNVDIEVDDNGIIDETELYNFLRQTPNHKVLGFAKLQLATYNLSGRDSTKWYNKWLRRVGQPPVIYDLSSPTLRPDSCNSRS